MGLHFGWRAMDGWSNRVAEGKVQSPGCARSHAESFRIYALVKSSKRPYGADSDVIFMTALQLREMGTEKLNHLVRNKKN